MTPTPHLRWIEASEREEEGPVAQNARGFTQGRYVLQQWFTNGNAQGEWRPVPTAWGSEPPKGEFPLLSTSPGETET